MKVLLFTHKSDIDGMGNAVLAKLAFANVHYVLTETFNLQQEVAKFYNDGSIYDYDRIFVTDLWLEDPMLSQIANDEKLKNKFFIFDHHKSAIESSSNTYSFITSRISDEHGLCSGTSLFYEYLISCNLISSGKSIKDFVELTRRYDTREWKTKYQDEMPHQLTLLFDCVGCDNYIEMMYKKLKNSKLDHFAFSDVELLLINNKIAQLEEKLQAYAKKIEYREIMGLRAGIIFIDYEHRNDIAEYLRENSYDLDFVMLIALDYGSISYRNIKSGVNVRTIAEAMGGKGHDYAASSPISIEQKDYIIRILTKGKSDI